MKLKTKNIILLEVYIKDKNKPLCEIELSSVNQIDEFYGLLNNEERFVRFGQMILDKQSFKCALVKYE